VEKVKEGQTRNNNSNSIKNKRTYVTHRAGREMELWNVYRNRCHY
jgi:hypothetical protein